MAVCPSCRRSTPAGSRICGHCGLELPGRTRLGITFPPEGKLGSTVIGPPPEQYETAQDGAEAGQITSEAPMARRFEEGAQETWYGHLPRPEGAPSDVAAPAEPPPARPGAVTRISTAQKPDDEAWFRVRGPIPSRTRPVRAAAQKRPWPRLEFLGASIPYWVLAASIGVAGLGGACAARFFPAPPALKVIGFEVTADGKDVLTVSCSGCPDGSTLRLGHAQAALRGGVAHLASSGLQVGENQLPLQLELPDGTAARIDVTVALAFRVSTDLRGITEVPPHAFVVVTAPRGTSVSVGGSPVPSEPGIARSRVDLSRDAEGPEARAVVVERKVPVRVLGPELERSTHATIAATVVPLVLDALPAYADGQWSLVGRTSPRALVQLLQAGSTKARVSADAGGRFLLKTPGAKPGAAILAASAPGRISRQLACQMPAPPRADPARD